MFYYPLDENSVSYFSIGFCILFFGGNLFQSQFPIPGFCMFFFCFAKSTPQKQWDIFGEFFYWGQGFSTTRTPKSCFFFVQFLALEKLVDLRNGDKKRGKVGVIGSRKVSEI